MTDPTQAPASAAERTALPSAQEVALTMKRWQCPRSDKVLYRLRTYEANYDEIQEAWRYLEVIQFLMDGDRLDRDGNIVRNSGKLPAASADTKGEDDE